MDVSKHVEKAEEALRKKNFDYAVELLQQVLSLQPDHGGARRLWCRALRLRHERKPTPGWLAKVVGSPHTLSAGLAKVSKSAVGKVRALEKNLKLEPTNTTINLALGRALSEAGYFHSAVAVLESLGEAEPKQSEAWKLAAACHARVQQIDEALECLEKALRASPRDAEAERMRKNLSADATLRSAAYDRARSSRDLMKDKDQVAKLERDQRLHRTEAELATEEEELRTEIGANPGNGQARRRLGEILARREDFEGAADLLEQGRAQDENVADLADRIGDYRVAALSREIRKLEKRLQDAPSDAVREDLEDLRKSRTQFEVTEFRRRVQERPTDLSLQYALGKSLQATGEVDDAIGAFQQAVRDPKTRLDSLIRLGSCFFRKGLLDLAEKQLTSALEETSPTSDRGKAILYNLGLISEKGGKKQEAFGFYTRIYEVDIQYRDVSQKIESLA